MTGMVAVACEPAIGADYAVARHNNGYRIYPLALATALTAPGHPSMDAIRR